MFAGARSGRRALFVMMRMSRLPSRCSATRRAVEEASSNTVIPSSTICAALLAMMSLTPPFLESRSASGTTLCSYSASITPPYLRRTSPCSSSTAMSRRTDASLAYSKPASCAILAHLCTLKYSNICCCLSKRIIFDPLTFAKVCNFCNFFAAP